MQQATIKLADAAKRYGAVDERNKLIPALRELHMRARDAWEAADEGRMPTGQEQRVLGDALDRALRVLQTCGRRGE